MKTFLTFAAAGLIGVGVGAYSALAMSGLLPGDRRVMEGLDINGWSGDLTQGSADASPIPAPALPATACWQWPKAKRSTSSAPRMTMENR